MRLLRHCANVGNFDGADAIRQIDANPGLWDQHPMRTTFPGTSFAETSDIWLRFGTDPKTYAGPHFADFYPAWHTLPALQPIVFRLMAAFKACHLGGVLLTRMPPGSKILPHSDRGAWHAEFYTTKVYAILRSNPQCVNHYEDESVEMNAGELWQFNNLVTHSVENNGSIERVAMIVCMRTE